MFKFLKWSNFKTRGRRDFLQNLSTKYGYRFSEDDDKRMIGYLKGFKLFSRGGRKKIKNIISLVDGNLNEKHYFDYHYTVSTGNSAVTHRQSVFFLKSKHLFIPAHSMKPEHIGHRIQELLFGLKDIDFEQYPEFSKNYLLKGEDENLIRTSYTDDLLHYFSENSGWSIEGANYYLILYFSSKLVHRNDYPLFIRECNRIADFFLDSSNQFKT